MSDDLECRRARPVAKPEKGAAITVRGLIGSEAIDAAIQGARQALGPDDWFEVRTPSRGLDDRINNVSRIAWIQIVPNPIEREFGPAYPGADMRPFWCPDIGVYVVARLKASGAQAEASEAQHVADNVVPMPPRLPPSIDGRIGEAAELLGTEDHVAAVFIRDTGRVTCWATEDLKTPEHWDWLGRRLEAALDTFRKMRAEQRPEIG